MPQVSIIIPTLNESEYLPSLLQSIKNQTYRDFEVIVADAGSKDDTRKIAESFGAQVVQGGMPGPGRNRGAEVAKGELLFFFDADVTLPPDFLQKATTEMNEKFLDLATCEFWPDSDLRLDRLMFNFANLTVKMNQSTNPRAAGFCIFIAARLFRRVGGFDESLRLAEDHDLVDRASKFRPLRVLTSTSLTVSIRRLAKEGRFSLLEKYFQVEWHLLTKGSIREDIVEYEFGNFEQKDEKARKALDTFEQRLIELEKRYDDFARDFLESNPWFANLQTNQEKWRKNIEKAMSSFRNLLFKGN